MQKLALVKLGGSVVTFKDKPLAANTQAIDRISNAFAQLDIPVIVIHGGGSYGHHWSVKYDMHTKPAPYEPHGVSIVHESMVALNQLIVNSLIKAGTNPYAIAPSAFTTGHKAIATKVRQLHEMALAGLIPVTFGDVIYMGGRKFSILSGDELMSIIAKILKPTRVIFATNVDGIYRDMESREVIQELKSGRKGSVEFSSGTVGIADVTGGMQRKVQEAFKIAAMGMDVMLVNGFYPERVVQALHGKVSLGTAIVKKKKESR